MSTYVDDLAAHILGDADLLLPVESGGAFGLTEDSVRPGPPVPPSDDEDMAGAVPALCVFLTPTGGISGRGRGEPDRPTVQVAVRSPPWDLDAGLALADAVYARCHLNPPAGYFDALSFSGRPAWLRQDEQGHHLIVFNLMMKRESA